MKVLPENLRSHLREPIGKVLDEKGLLEFLSKDLKLVTVGDMVTYSVLKHDYEPVFCVVDYHTRRGKCSEDIVGTIQGYGEKVVNVSNPAGCISSALWDAIKDTYGEFDKFDGIRIEVDGEEDLASLVSIFFAPIDVTVIYGLPDKGVLVVEPTSENKDKVKDVFDKMVEK